MTGGGQTSIISILGDAEKYMAELKVLREILSKSVNFFFNSQFCLNDKEVTFIYKEDEKDDGKIIVTFKKLGDLPGIYISCRSCWMTSNGVFLFSEKAKYDKCYACCHIPREIFK